MKEEEIVEVEEEFEEELPIFDKFTIIPNHQERKLDEEYENFDLLVDLNE